MDTGCGWSWAVSCALQALTPAWDGPAPSAPGEIQEGVGVSRKAFVLEYFKNLFQSKQSFINFIFKCICVCLCVCVYTYMYLADDGAERTPFIEVGMICPLLESLCGASGSDLVLPATTTLLGYLLAC